MSLVGRPSPSTPILGVFSEVTPRPFPTTFTVIVCAAQSAVTMATIIEPQRNRHVYEVNIPKSLKLFVWIIYVDYPRNKLHILYRIT